MCGDVCAVQRAVICSVCVRTSVCTARAANYPRCVRTGEDVRATHAPHR